MEGSEGWAEGRERKGCLEGGRAGPAGQCLEGKDPRVSSRRNGKPLAGLKLGSDIISFRCSKEHIGYWKRMKFQNSHIILST